MGKHSTQVIRPFPESMDRVAFGHWLSGFTDGEGCFFLSVNTQARRKHQTPAASFLITLRDDDSQILGLIQSFLQCGWLQKHETNCSPATKFIVRRIADLVDVVVPHFEAFPLRAKKLNDFLIWKEGVAVLSRTIKRTPTIKTGQPRRISGKRTWTPEDIAEFAAITTRLRDQRKYKSLV